MKPIWRTNAENILRPTPHGEAVASTFVAVLNMLDELDWQGACRASSAILHVALKHQGISTSIAMGEAAVARHAFDHSWVVLREGILDAAITIPERPEFALPPTILGLDGETMQTPRIVYGITSGQPIGPDASLVLGLPFYNFMELELNLWAATASILARVGSMVEWQELRALHGTGVRWKWNAI